MESASASALWTGQAPSPEKSSQLLIRDYPHRSIAIASSNHALLLRYSPTTGEAISNGSLPSISSARPRSSSTDGTSSKCIVEFSPITRGLLSEYRPLVSRPVFGTLGLINIGRDVFICIITQASRVATVRPGETIERILGVQFFCLNSAEYDDVYTLDALDNESSDAASVYGQNLGRRDIPVEHPCQELQKLLSNGSFYYSTDFDVTNRLQDRSVESDNFDIDNFDEQYLWNSYMISPLVQFRENLQPKEREALDASRILTSAVRGFCLSIAIPQIHAPLRSASSGLPSYLTVISRLSCRRAGTRFNSRGIDDDGNVANFVETETLYWSPSGAIFSYVQVRGSVPVFWEQAASYIPGQQKISITRSPEGTQPAFNKHFDDLEHAYGAVHVVNLLSASKPGEAELSALYRNGVAHCPLSRTGEKSRDHALLRETEYDFHAETKGPTGYEAAREIRRYLENSADGFAYYLAEETDDAGDEGHGHVPRRRYVVVLQQEGVFRTNCLDCLDRTNLIQTVISQMALESFLQHRSEFATSDFWMRHSSLWADNGDNLSRIYAGTGALKSSFTRHGKMSLGGALSDIRKSATRLYINNFSDSQRQNTIDQLLGRLVGQSPVVVYDPIADYVTAELQKRNAEFSSNDRIKIWVGTFNLNGRTDGIDEDLSPWICPPEIGNWQPEIMVVGFQEIVELSPQQIMNSDPTRKQMWEKAVKRTLKNHAQRIGGEKYVLLRSGQLVGAALCIFVKASCLPRIKNVEGSVKKTGMSGMAGNKGAVAIRFDYANTQICLVTAHLAAGFANYEERNKDYATIHHGLRFQRNRSIDNHDTVIWLGDFNYRIGLGLERARELVRKRDLEHLYENDQLNLQMVAGLAFPFYSEARITFMPTYKFDIGKDEYDSSEKARIPAWTDRILRKGTNIRQLSYNSAPLRFSDHRPVYATFECAVTIVDEAVREKISREIYERRRGEVGDTQRIINGEDSEDEDLIGYDAIEPGLPPASSDRQRWWLENGKMARSTATPPKSVDIAQRSSLNERRPSNPFPPAEEPDWVAVPRSESRMSTFSAMSTSPYEHINHSMLLSTSASSSAPRKLPPPYDPSALPLNFAKVSLGQDAGQRQTESPPPPPPRRQTGATASRSSTPGASSTPSHVQELRSMQGRPPLVKDRSMTGLASTGSDGARPSPKPLPPPRVNTIGSSQPSAEKAKPAPRVAKKPAHLTAGSPTDSNTSSTPTGSRRSSDFQAKPDLPRRSSTVVHGYANSPASGGVSRAPGPSSAVPPTLPRRSGTTATAPLRSTTPGGSAVSGIARLDSQRKVSPIPVARKQQQQQQQPPQQQNVDLLGDDAGMDMGAWEAMRPT